jgi:hypothetical protein
MTYDQQIFHILTQVGERGISGALLAKHLYNQNCTFFSQPDLQELQQYVRQFLFRNSRSPQSLLENAGRRGYYRLNTGNSADARQLMLQFSEDEEESESTFQKTSPKDFSLSLFNDDECF